MSVFILVSSYYCYAYSCAMSDDFYVCENGIIMKA